MVVLVRLIFVASILQLINEVAGNSPYSNNFGEELDHDPVEPKYLPTVNGIISKCTYVRHFGAYSGNISCPNTASALTTIQTKGLREPSGVGSSNQHLPNTNWSMQCECPLWSYQSNPLPLVVMANTQPRITWMPFTIFPPNTTFSCSYNEFLSGLAYQYNEQSGNFTWWGRCTRFQGYFISGESCHDSVRRLLDGEDKLLTLYDPMRALHGVDDYPVQQGTNSPALYVSGTNRRGKQFRECTVTPIPGCDNPTIDHGSTTLLPSASIPTSGQLNIESGRDRTKYGDSLQVSCNSGYYIEGPSVITCQTNGSWTQLPTCKPCRPIRNCLALECKHGNESLCLECRANIYFRGIPLKMVLKKNRKKCRIIPHILRNNDVSEIRFERWDSVQLHCCAVGRPIPTIRWTYLTANQSVELLFRSYRWTIHSNGSLVLNNLSDVDEGIYACTAVNEVGLDSVNFTLISKEAELRSELEGNSSVSAPKIHNKAPFILFYSSGTRVLLHCNATGNPQPTIAWYKLEEGKDKLHSVKVPAFRSRDDIGILTLEFHWIYKAWDVGIYTCLATNKYGSDMMHKYVCIGNSCTDLDQTP